MTEISDFEPEVPKELKTKTQLLQDELVTVELRCPCSLKIKLTNETSVYCSCGRKYQLLNIQIQVYDISRD